MDLSEATGRLALEPTREWRVGAPRTDGKGAALSGAYPESYWTAPLLNGEKVLSSEVSLDEALSAVVGLLAPHRKFLASISAGGQCECFIGLFASENFGVEIPVALMRELVELSVCLGIDGYP